MQADAEFCPYYERGFCHKGAHKCRFDHYSKKVYQNFMLNPTSKSSEHEMNQYLELLGRVQNGRSLNRNAADICAEIGMNKV